MSDPTVTEIDVHTFTLTAGFVLVIAYADVEDGSGRATRLTAQSQVREADATGVTARLYERDTSFALTLYAQAAGQELVLATGVWGKYQPSVFAPPTPEEILVRELGEEDAARALAVLTDAGFWITERDWDEED